MRTEHLEHDGGDGATCEAYVACEDGGEAKRPCVLVAHAWAGQTDAERGKAEELAGLGYVGVALDVYGKGVRGEPAGDNSALMAPFLADRAMLRRRLLAGVEAARAHPRVDPDRIAAIGYCFGGLCVLDLARASAPGLRGVVSLHGVLAPPRLGPQQRIGAKALVLHGWADPMAPPDDVLALAAELTDAGADWQLHAYGHALHAFTFAGANFPERGIKYDAAADRRSGAAMRYFLEEVLA